MPPKARRFPPVLFALLVFGALPVPGQDADRPAAPAALVPGVVRIGGAEPVAVAVGLEGRTPVERAEVATRVLHESLRDPACDADGFTVEPGESTLLYVTVCGRRVLAVSVADAAAAGMPPARLAEQWSDGLRAAWTKEKVGLFSRRLVEVGILGVLYPLLFLAVLVLWRMIVRGVQRRVESIGGRAGIRLGPVVLAAAEGDRGLISRLIGLLGWAGSLLLIYVFLIVLFDRFPRTARWAREMLEPLAGFSAAAGDVLLSLAPRILALLVMVVIVRALLRSVGRLCDQVRARQLRIDPILTPDTAGPTEITARVLILGVFVFVASLLVPGEPRTVLLAAFALLGLALAFGSRPLVENLLAGVVVLYGRPFRTGDAVRIGTTEGVVERKGFIHLRVRRRDDRMALVPNHRVLLEAVRVIDAGRALRLEVWLRRLRDTCEPEGLFRHAAAEAGLRREDGTVQLVEIREGDLGYRVVWALPPHSDSAVTRDAFLRSMAARSSGLGVEVRSAREESATP